MTYRNFYILITGTAGAAFICYILFCAGLYFFHPLEEYGINSVGVIGSRVGKQNFWVSFRVGDYVDRFQTWHGPTVEMEDGSKGPIYGQGETLVVRYDPISPKSVAELKRGYPVIEDLSLMHCVVDTIYILREYIVQYEYTVSGVTYRNEQYVYYKSESPQFYYERHKKYLVCYQQLKPEISCLNLAVKYDSALDLSKVQYPFVGSYEKGLKAMPTIPTNKTN